MGRNLRFFRKARNLSQSELAQRIGLKRNNIASYEAGLVEPRAATFIRLAEFFEVNAGRFLTEDLTGTINNKTPVDSRNRPVPRTSATATAALHQIQRQLDQSERVRDQLRQQLAHSKRVDGYVTIPSTQLTEFVEALDELHRINTHLLNKRYPSDLE